MDMTVKIEIKTCTKCEKEKQVNEVYGIARSHCKDCERSAASERMKQYNATFRGKASQALQTARKAVKRVECEQGVEVDDTLTLPEVMMTLADLECAWCGRDTPENERTLDHITPIKYSHKNEFSGVCMACADCNRLKSDIPAILHMIREGTDTYEARQLIDRIALRSRRTFKEAFEQLAADTKTYYDTKAAEAIAAIEMDGETDEQ